MNKKNDWPSKVQTSSSKPLAIICLVTSGLDVLKSGSENMGEFGGDGSLPIHSRMNCRTFFMNPDPTPRIKRGTDSD